MAELEEKAIKELCKVRGIGPASAKKLVEAGITSIADLASARPEEVRDILGTTSKRAKLIIQYAKDCLFEQEVLALAAKELEKIRSEKVQIISTGVKAIDAILGGGFRTDALHLLAGSFSTGKTAMCYQVGVKCAIDYERCVLFIETEPQVFHASRVREIAKGFGADPEAVLDKFYVIPSERIKTPEQLFTAYDYAEKMITKDKIDIGVIIIDSFSAPFRAYYHGRETLTDRSQEIARHIGKLEYLADKFNAAIIATAQVYGVPDLGLQIAHEARMAMRKAIYGGELQLHSFSYILVLERVGKEKCVITLVDSSHLPRKSAYFSITREGLRDV